VYRKISATIDLCELQDVTGELRDRFGPPPPEMERVVSLRELQLLAHDWGTPPASAAICGSSTAAMRIWSCMTSCTATRSYSTSRAFSAAKLSC
jgi:hypothetical protein